MSIIWALAIAVLFLIGKVYSQCSEIETLKGDLASMLSLMDEVGSNPVQDNQQPEHPPVMKKAPPYRNGSHQQAAPNPANADPRGFPGAASVNPPPGMAPPASQLSVPPPTGGGGGVSLQDLQNPSNPLKAFFE